MRKAIFSIVPNYSVFLGNFAECSLHSVDFVKWNLEFLLSRVRISTTPPSQAGWLTRSVFFLMELFVSKKNTTHRPHTHLTIRINHAHTLYNPNACKTHTHTTHAPHTLHILHTPHTFKYTHTIYIVCVYSWRNS